MRLLLDTNAYSAIMAGESGARRLVSFAERVYLPMPVIGELLYGFRLGNQPEFNQRILHDFLGQSVVSLAGVDYEVCEEYARIGKGLRAAGKPIPTNDHWIAAIAVRNHLSLMTRDGHFENVASLDVLHW